jgi:hypothetical protein
MRGVSQDRGVAVERRLACEAMVSRGVAVERCLACEAVVSRGVAVERCLACEAVVSRGVVVERWLACEAVVSRGQIAESFPIPAGSQCRTQIFGIEPGTAPTPRWRGDRAPTKRIGPSRSQPGYYGLASGAALHGWRLLRPRTPNFLKHSFVFAVLRSDARFGPLFLNRVHQEDYEKA